MSILALSPFSASGLIEAQGIELPAGFGSAKYFGGLSRPTSMTFGPDRRLYVAQQGGEVVAIVDDNGDGVGDRKIVYADGFGTLLGLAFVGPDLYASHSGKVTLVRDMNGDGQADFRKDIVAGLPTGRHQNDEVVLGPDGFLYMGIGSTTDTGPERDERSATIVRFEPDGSEFEIYARGLRNPYGLAFDRDGNLFATDNGPDSPPGPDELNHIVKGGNYGYPDYFGDPPPGSGTIAPVVNLQTHSSSNGFAFYYGSQFPEEYRGNAFIAQWGSLTNDPAIGKRIVRVPLTPLGSTFKGEELVFATGFERPIDVVVDHEGALLVSDWGTGDITRIYWMSLVTPSVITVTPRTITLEPLTLREEGGQPGTTASLPAIALIAATTILVTLLWLTRRRGKVPATAPPT